MRTLGQQGPDCKALNQMWLPLMGLVSLGQLTRTLAVVVHESEHGVLHRLWGLLRSSGEKLLKEMCRATSMPLTSRPSQFCQEPGQAQA